MMKTPKDTAEPSVPSDLPVQETENEPEPLGLSPEEISTIAEQVAKQVEKEIASAREVGRKQLIKDATERELQAQRRSAGLTDHKDDLIEYMIDCPAFTDQIVWDGRIYQHGQWVKQPRHVYDSMRETMARAHDADERAGLQRKYRALRDPMTGSTNPMIREMRMPDGSFTLYHETRINGRTGAVSLAPVGEGG